MRTLFFFTLFSSILCAQPQVVMMGGGDYYSPTVRRFSELARGRSGNILVIPWASENGHKAFLTFKEVVQTYMGAQAPRVVEAVLNTELPHRIKGEDLILKAIDEATGIFFTGGDQSVLMEKLKTNPSWIPAISRKAYAGMVVGGSSAGTAIMNENMPTGVGDETVIDPTKIETKKGLGFIRGVLIDQHFIKRQRQNRLFSLLIRGPECFGFGIDEDNGVHVINDETVEVLGPGLVMSMDRCGRDLEFSVKLHQPGEIFFLKR